MANANTWGSRINGPSHGEDNPRPALLFLCQTLPFPPDGGVQIRSFNILKLLAAFFDITALCFYRRANRRTEDAVARGVAGFAELARVEAFPIPQEHTRVRLGWDHLRSVALRRVYTRYAYDSGDYRKRLNALLASRHFDLVHVDSLDLSAYLPAVSHLPVVCTHHNVESELLRRRARTEARALTRRYLALQADLMEAEEREWCSQVQLNVTVSPNDAERLMEIAPGARVAVVPNGVDTQMFQPSADPGDGLVFVGGSSWHPNREAMAFFVDEILPEVRREHPDVTVTWVGRSPADLREEYRRRHGVELTGYVEDIRPHVQKAACYVAPLQVGGGTRLKILDAWAMGKAVVSTSVGCEGLAARDEDNILVRDEPRQFAAAVNRILQDTKLRARLGASARETAERLYDWDVIGNRMIGAYFEATTVSRAAPAG